MPRAIEAWTWRPTDWSWSRSSFWFVTTSESVAFAARGTRPGTGPVGLPRTMLPARSTMQPYALTTTNARILVGPQPRYAPPRPGGYAPAPGPARPHRPAPR